MTSLVPRPETAPGNDTRGVTCSIVHSIGCIYVDTGYATKDYAQLCCTTSS